MKVGTRVFLLSIIAFVLAGAVAAAQSKDGDLSEAFIAKYSPLVDEYKASLDAGKFDQALKQAQAIRASIGKEKEVGPNHPVIVQVDAMIAQTYVMLRKYKEAETIYADTQARLGKLGRADSEEMLFTLQNVRELYKAWGNQARLKDADDKYKALVARHPEWAELGEGKGGQGDEAAKKYKPIMEKARQALDSGDTDGALKIAEEAARDCEKEFGASNPMSIEFDRLLADIYNRRGDGDSAAAALDKAIVAMEGDSKQRGMDLVYVYQYRAEIFRQQGSDQEAKSLDNKIKAILDKDPQARKQYEEDMRRQDEKRKAEGDKPQGDKGPGNAKSQPFFDEKNKLDQIFKSGKKEEAVKSMEGLLDRAKAELPPGDPFLQDASMTLARFYSESGQADKAAAMVSGGMDLSGMEARKDYAGLAGAYRGMADTLDRAGRVPEALDNYEKAWQMGQKALDAAKALPKGKDPQALANAAREYLNAGEGLAFAYSRMDRSADAEALFKTIIAASNQYQPDDLRAFNLMQGLADGYTRANRPKDLEPLCAQMAAVADKFQKNPPKPDPKKPESMEGRPSAGSLYLRVAQYYSWLKKPKEGLDMAAKARAAAEKEKDNPDSPRVLSGVADFYAANGKAKEAEQLYRMLIPLFAKNDAVDPLGQGDFYRGLGRFYMEQKKYPEAQKQFEASAEAYQRAAYPNPMEQANVLRDLQGALKAQGKAAEAAAVLDRVQALLAGAPAGPGQGQGSDPRMEVVTYFEKADALRGQGKPEESDKLLREADEAIKKKYGEQGRAYAIYLTQRAFFYNPDSRTTEDLLGLRQRAIDIFEKIGDKSGDYAWALTDNGRAYAATGDYSRALPLLERAVAVLEPMGPDGGVADALSNLGSAYLKAGKDPAQAEKLLSRAIDLNAKRSEKNEGFASMVMADLGYAYFLEGRSAEAEKAYKQAEDYFVKQTKVWPDFHPDFRSLYDRMAQLYEKNGNAAAAKEYRDKLKKM